MRAALAFTAALLLTIHGALAQQAGAPYAVPRFRQPEAGAKPPELSGLPVIRFLADENFPPFSYRDSAGALTGFSIATANALCDELKLTCQFAAKAYGELLPALEKNEADALITGARVTPEALEKARFTRPYYRSLARFAVLAENPVETADARSLAGKRLGVIAGSVHEAYLNDNFSRSTRRAFPDFVSAAKALQAREVDAIFADAAALMFWTLSPASDNCCRLADGAYADAERLSPGMSILVKPDGKRLQQVLDYGLDRLESSGVQAVIFRRFFPESPW